MSWAERFIIYVEACIDRWLPTPLERMVMKLYMENYPRGQIAKFCGVSEDYVNKVIAQSGLIMERNFGWPFKKLHGACIQCNAVCRNS